jgi:hypothetical protein
MASPEQVVAALHALYHANDTTQQAQANDWLTSFQRSDAAWQVPFVLLVPQQPDEVQFFAATLLVRKVRSEWTKLDAPSRQGLNQAIRCAAQRGRHCALSLMLLAAGILWPLAAAVPA